MKGLKTFISYSHKDNEFCNELQKWLAPLKENGHISEWYDKNLLGGDKLNDEIKKNLKESDVILILLSQNYLSSSACQEEMAFALSNIDDKRIIPIILKPCTWQETDLSGILALPEDGKAISTWNSLDDAWLNVFTGIKNVIEHLQESFDIKTEFFRELQRVEFVKSRKVETNLDDLFFTEYPVACYAGSAP